MTCDQIRPKLSAYVDGELPEDERENVRRHLDTCLSCAQELRELEETAELLGHLEQADPPDTLESGLRRRIRRRAAGLLTITALLALTVIPVAAMASLVLRPDLPLWARVGFAVSTTCLTVALALLVLFLLGHVRSLVVYGYLVGGRRS